MKVFKTNFSNVKYTIKRFPMAIICGFLLTIISIYTAFNNDFLGNSRIVTNVLTVGIFLFIFISLLNSFLQSIFNKSYYKYISNGIGVIVLVILFFIGKGNTLYEEKNMGMFFLDIFFTEYKIGHILLGIMIASIIGSLFIEKINNVNGLGLYIFKVIRSFAISMIFSLVTLGISMLIMYTLNSLFIENLEDKYYALVFYTIMIMINLIIFLSNYPDAFIFEDYTVPKSFKTLLTNVVMVLVSVFGLLLIVYFIMILIQRNILVRQIAYLVVVYGILTVSTLLISGITEESKIKTIYKKFAPISILPLLIMLFYSMGKRINNYGITENRYYIILIGVFLLFSSLYFIFNKYKNNVPVLVAFCLISIIGTIGPLSGYNLSTKSQSKRLEYYLNKNNMLKDGQLVPVTNVNNKDKEEISNILLYFRENKEENILDNTVVLEKDFYENSSKYLGFEVYYDGNNADNFISYGYNAFKPEEISEYNKISKVSYDNYINESSEYKFKIEENNLIVIYEKTEVKIPITEIEEKIKEAEKTEENLVLDLKFNENETKWIVTSLYMNKADGSINIEAMVLTK